jgi:hypothetical protein
VSCVCEGAAACDWGLVVQQGLIKLADMYQLLHPADAYLLSTAVYCIYVGG